MNPLPPDPIRRVLAVLDPLSPNESVVEVATYLAGLLRVGGLALLLRDEALLSAGDLPVVHEVQRVPASVVSRTRASAEHQFRARAHQVEQRLRRAAPEGYENWDVRIAFGVTRDVVLRSIREGDLLIVGQDPRSGTAYTRLGATLLAQGPYPVLMVTSAAQSVRSVQVICETNEEGRRQILLAGAMASSLGTASVGIIVVDREGDGCSVFSESITDALAERGLAARVVVQSHLNLAEGRRLLDADEGLLILPSTHFQGEQPPLIHTLRVLGWPFLIVD